MDKRTRAKFTTLAKRVNEASGTAADLATAKTDIENLKTSKANIEDLTAAAGRIDVLEAESASVKQLVAGKANVTDLTAATGRIDDLEADTVSLEQAVVEKASIADLNATNVEISNLKTDKANITDLNAATAEIDALKTNKANVTDLTAATGRIDDLEADTASLGQAVAEKASIADLNAVNAEIDTLKTGKANVTDLTAATGRIDALETENASVKELVASKADVKDLTAATGRIDSLETGKADVDLLNVAKATIENLLVRGGIITDSLTGVEINATKFLTGVTIIGDVIKAGTLAANRIILTGENGLIYELNVNAGNLTASQLTEEQYKQALDGSVLVASSITTDKLAAGSVTAQVIASGAVTTDKLEVGAVKAKHIDVDDLFAQNITATGTITGAKLIGAVLSGGSIDISGTFDGYTGASEGYIRTLGDESGSPQLILGMGENRIKITDDAMESIVLDGPMIYIGAPGGASDTTVYNLWVQGDVSADGKHNTYTSFSGGVLSSGSVTVSKKLGMCYISGTLTLSKSISAWTTILSSSKVPAPQHGELVPFEASQWGTSYARPLRGKVTPDGGLQLVYGAAGNYVFTIAYPID